MISAVQTAAVVAGTALATAVAAPVLRPVLGRWGLIDVPNHRSSHQHPTLRGGGLAPLLGLLLVALVTGVSAGSAMSVSWAALLTCVLAALIGLVVDLAEPPPWTRLLGQLLLGAALGALLSGIPGAVLGGIAMPVLVNVVNFMDGIDGITTLTVVAWGLVVLVATATLGGTSVAAVTVAALAVGAAAGFLPWNVRGSRMFLGDCGSYLFGALVAAALLLEQSSGTRPWLVLVPLLPYLLDTGLTLLRRARRGAPLTQAHREHLYQRLSRRPGWTHLRVAVLWAGSGLVLGAAAVLLVQNGAL